MSKNLSRYLVFLLFFSLIPLYALFLFRPIFLTGSDLGRHIANGREIIAGNTSVLYTNAYSYTHPDQPFINHHWLTGVVFYYLELFTGFIGLQLLHSVLLFTMFGIFCIVLYTATSKKSPWIIFLTSILALLFFGARTEIRPESFGYLFISILLLYLFSLEKQKDIFISWKAILGILLMQMLWVNLHISFIFGIFLTTLFLISTTLIPKLFARTKLSKTAFADTKLSMPEAKKLGLLVLAQILVSIINPNHIKGLFAPFSIFTNYGYSVVENQTMWFLRAFSIGPVVSLYFITALFLILLLILFWKKVSAFSVFLAVIGIILGYMALRNMPLFVLFSFPFLAQALVYIQELIQKKITIEAPSFYFPVLSLSLFAIIFFIIASGNYKSYISLKTIQLGLAPNQLAAAQFYKENNLEGPIFNNYDLGSYLIYALPDEKVFVDNRPEAYTVPFFSEEYKPMQMDPDIWQGQVEKNNIKTVVFGHTDMTPWARKYLQDMMINPDWKPIYKDQYTIIFASRL